MAENKSQAQHLTSLDFDISGIIKTLQEADEQTQEMGLQIGKNFSTNFQKGANENIGKDGTSFSNIIDEKSIKSATTQIDRLDSSYGKLAKTVKTFNDESKTGSLSKTFIDESGIQTVVKYNTAISESGEIAQKTSETITQNYSKQEEQTERLKKQIDDLIYKRERFQTLLKNTSLEGWIGNVYEENEKLLQSLYGLDIGVSGGDTSIKDATSQLSAYQTQAKRLKDTYTDFSKLEKEQKTMISQLETLIEKQEKFNLTVSKQKSSSKNKQIIEENKSLISSAQELVKKIDNQSISFDGAEKQIEEYQNKAKELGKTYDTLGTQGDSFLKKVSDKAYWLGAFYVVNELIQGFQEAIGIIKETEDAVVDLQRVLNDDSLSKSVMSSELYDIAYEYGRTFDEVAEVSTAFAQAGYDWNDTMELTKGTMLALNTAELDVTDSTQGLIAIMQQWNLTAEDYADVIDKINITADNFAVNSENIVAALQRASSSAKNANISLERTIGIITALAEATGRSGENIGTALNSLIVYTSKSSALETFAEVGSDAMKRVVKEYQSGAASIYDVWVQLSEEVQNLSAQQQEDLFTSDDFQELSTELESALGDVYGAAGTYRQNYFIALLNDMDTAEEAINNLTASQGYSASENEKYMESLSANWNQLKDMLAELAVQLGNVGGLSILKGLTQIGISLTQITGSLGGILPILTSIGGIIVTLKAEKLAKNVVDIYSGIKKIPSEIKNIVTNTISLVTATNSATVAEQGATAAASAWKIAFGWIGIVSAAISALVMVISGFSSAAKEARDASVSNASAALDEADSLRDLKDEYISILDSADDKATKDEKLAKISNTLATQYGVEKEALDKINESREYGIDLLTEESNKKITEAYSDIATEYEKAKDKLEKSYSGFTVNAGLTGLDNKTLNVLEQYGIILDKLDASVGPALYDFSIAGEDIEEQLENLKAANAALQSAGITIPELEDKISSLNSIIEDNSEAYEKGTEAFAQYLVYADDAFAELRENVSDVDSFNAFRDAIMESAGSSEYLAEAIDDILSDLYPEFASSSEEVGETVSNSFSITQDSIDGVKEKIEELNDSIDGFQSGFDAVNSAIEEYNENGYLSIDTIQSLISAGGEYLSMLDFTADGIQLNESATKNLLQEQKNNIDAMLQQAMTADVLETVQRYLAETTNDVESSTENAGNAAETAAGQVADLATQAMNGAISMSEFNKQLKSVMGETANEIDYSGLQSDLNGIITRYQNLSKVIGDVSANTSAWSNKASSAASNAAKEQTEAVKKQLEAQKEAVKDRYDAEIQALKDVQEENDRLQKQEEYYRNRQEALNDIEKASTRSGVEYREQESEARQKLEELDREWQETVADWSIDDKISELEALRDAEVAAIDAQIDALESSTSSIGTNMVKTSSNANKQMVSNYSKEYLDPVSDNTETTYENMFDDMQTNFSTVLDNMLEFAKLNSTQLYNIYNSNFFSQMGNSFARLQSQLLSVQAFSPKIPSIPFSSSTGYASSQNVVNNTTQNANVFANVYGTSSANTLINGIFTKPK